MFINNSFSFSFEMANLLVFYLEVRPLLRLTTVNYGLVRTVRLSIFYYG